MRSVFVSNLKRLVIFTYVMISMVLITILKPSKALAVDGSKPEPPKTADVLQRSESATKKTTTISTTCEGEVGPSGIGLNSQNLGAEKALIKKNNLKSSGDPENFLYKEKEKGEEKVKNGNSIDNTQFNNRLKIKNQERYDARLAKKLQEKEAAAKQAAERETRRLAEKDKHDNLVLTLNANLKRDRYLSNFPHSPEALKSSHTVQRLQSETPSTGGHSQEEISRELTAQENEPLVTNQIQGQGQGIQLFSPRRELGPDFFEPR